MKSRIMTFFKPKTKLYPETFSPQLIKNIETMKRKCELISKTRYSELDTSGMKEALEKSEKAEGTTYNK